MLRASQSSALYQCYPVVKSPVLKKGPGLWGTILSLSSLKNQRDPYVSVCVRGEDLDWSQPVCYAIYSSFLCALF